MMSHNLLLIILIAVVIVPIIIGGYNKAKPKMKKTTQTPGHTLEEYTRQLNVETAMEAIKYNGFIPETDGTWIRFMVQGEKFFVDVTRCPVVHFSYSFSIDQNHNVEDMKKAMLLLSDRIIMGRAYIEEDNEGISFIVDSFERNYGHFRDTLNDYINLLYETRRRFGILYDEIQTKRNEENKIISQINRTALPS
ncbi:MAG: hypothetical protein IJK74_06650 [Bacteroidales bacterium]|nr:hypothetical protein [Bacteroidales bacterium]